jgi:hypothetical protein
MPSERLEKMIAEQKGGLGTKLPQVGLKGVGAMQQKVRERARATEELESGAGVRLRQYEEAAMENLRKRKEAEGQTASHSLSVSDPNAPIGSNGREIIDRCFVSIGGVKSFTPFHSLTPAQLECIDVLKEHQQSIMSSRSRDLYLGELILSITGNEDEEDEPVGSAAFSQFHFYRTYIRELVYYPDKFDFLLRCIENCVVKVQQPARFKRLIERISTRNQVTRLPDSVVNYEKLLEEDDEMRRERFVLRKDWVCQVPHYLDGVGEEDSRKALE